MTTHINVNEKLLSTSEVLIRLGIPMYKLRYLFQVGKLNDRDFIKLHNGHRVYRECDIPKIREALFSVQNK
jgi:DNA-binding transcriptional MerR regulator